MWKIEKGINELLKEWEEAEHHPDERDASFDYCYNYFRGFYVENRIPELADDKNMQMSCLQLGFYLASWGMFRKSFLLGKSLGHYIRLINAISKMGPKLWDIDVDNYEQAGNIKLLIDCSEAIKQALGTENTPSDTLVTKIMLGVFANVPAYDTYFKIFLRDHEIEQTFNAKSLEQVSKFFSVHNEEINSFEVRTYDFLGHPNKNVVYKKVKLVDIIGFKYGQEASKRTN